MRKKAAFTILFCFLVLILLYPYQSTSIPEWKIQVVDNFGNPIPNAKVRQTWSPPKEQGEETLVTNDGGVVVFSARTIRKPLLLRFITGLSERINHSVMPHGSPIGSYASVFSAEGARTNELYYSEGGMLEQKLIFQDYP